MKLLTALFILIAIPLFGANPDYKAFRGINGIFITTNPPNGTIVIDGSGISGGSATNAQPPSAALTNAAQRGVLTISNANVGFLNSAGAYADKIAGHMVPSVSNTYDKGSFLLPDRTNWVNNVVVKATITSPGSSSGANNEIFGAFAGNALTTGIGNTAVGRNALLLATVDNYNTAIGVDALATNASEGITAVGYGALKSHTTGDANTAVGYRAMLSTTTGNYNTAIGKDALNFNTTGSGNGAFGETVLLQNTTGNGNNGLGEAALYNNKVGNFNTSIGSSTLASNTNGSQNTAVGRLALNLSISGDDNVAVGDSALLKSLGSQNTAVGRGALYENTSGANNVAAGHYALLNNTSGRENIGVGHLAGQNLTTGSSNIVIGNDMHAPSSTSAQTLNIGNILFGNAINGSGTTLSSGNIGIGTPAPLGKFAVSGISDSYLFRLNTNAIVFTNGSLGIGTGTPLADRVHVAGINHVIGAGYNDYGNLFISTTATNLGNFGGTLALGAMGNNVTAYPFAKIHGKKTSTVPSELDGYLAIEVGNNTTAPYSIERLRILHNGNVGIGSQVPSSTLDVTGQVRMASALSTNSVSVLTSDGTPRVHMAVIPSAATFGGQWFGNITPSTLNWSIGGDGSGTYLNVNTGGEIYFQQAGGTLAWMNAGGDLTLFSGQFQLGGTNAGFPALGRMTNGSGGNGDLIVNGADGVFTGASTNRLLVPGGIGVGILTPTNANGLSVLGNTSLRSNLFLPNLRTNGAPVALLGVDAAGAVFESAVGSAGGFSVSGNSNQIPFLNVAGTGFLFGSHDKSAPGFGMVNRANGNIGALLIHVNENEDIGLVQIGPPNAGSSIATFVPSLSISNRYDGGLTQEMVRVNYVDVGGTDAESMLQTWRNWDSAGVNLVSYSGLRKDGRLSLAGGLRLMNGATLTNVLYATTNINFPSAAAGTVFDAAVSVPGAADGEIVSLGVPSGSIGPLAGGIYSAWASNEVVYIRFANNALATAMDPASGLFRVRVDRFAP